jgi:ABC-type lipoprotein release transport system permease subunit
VRSNVGRTARILVFVVLAMGTVRLKPDTTYAQIRPTADAANVKADATHVDEVRPRAESTNVKADPARVPEILLSRQLMDEAGVHIGDEVTLAAAADGRRATRFRVVGTYEPVPDPRKFSAKRLDAHLHLPDLVALAQDPKDPESGDQVSALNLALVHPSDAEAVARALARRVPGMTAQPTARSARRGDDPFAVLERFHEAIAMVTVTGSTAFLLALMVMRAEERREIIGILRLIGIPSRSILVEVLLEGLLIAVAGAIFGILVAVAAQGLVNRFFQWRYDTTLVFVRVTTSIALEAVAFAVPLGVVAGLAASWTLLRRSVISLVRR